MLQSFPYSILLPFHRYMFLGNILDIFNVYKFSEFKCMYDLRELTGNKIYTS